MGIRYARALSGLALVASVVIAPAATAAPDASCTAILGGDWADENGTCSTTVGSVRAATMNMSAQLPRELLDHPTAGQVLKSYLGPLTEGWRKTGESMVRDSDYRVDYQSFSHDASDIYCFSRVLAGHWHHTQRCIPNVYLRSGRRLRNIAVAR
jgi:hypothetical protein